MEMSSRDTTGVIEAAPLCLVDRAALLARRLLADVPERLAHSAAVTHRAADLAVTIDPRQESMLVATAWLHDIGYAPALARTGFHPLDGARALRAWRWPSLMCRLVAHHSGSSYLARQMGLCSSSWPIFRSSPDRSQMR
jgi:hypothetical protein